ncbi:MAG: PQQ-binding-like beta-propeller repeat protein, partial [Phenylobacterium sp.]
WDLGNAAITGLPPEGQSYTRGTPNVWSTPAFDPALGLVYLPTGNATPDYWGSHRSDAADAYASSVVALDIATGRERWRFQTVHHDLWDYDVPAQPMLADVPAPGGGTVPAVIQLTKRGQIFVLDRATGRPITPVVEKAVPQRPAKGEWTSPTQPYSVGMPVIGEGPLTEKMMWGTTPLDQLACRIAFRSHRYEGEFTPPGGDRPSLQYPSNGGGQNWGSGTLDPTRRYLIVPDLRMAMSVHLEPARRPGLTLDRAAGRSARGAQAVAYQSENDWMVSPIQVPCLQPPNGTLTAIDLATRKIAWQVPLGSAEESGPLGLASGLPIPLGTVGLGGPISTAGGLTFHASTSDPYLRAYDTGTGRVLWKARLPVGAGGTPMSYVSPATGRQYVVVSAGGARQRPQRGDYVIAFALPK